MVQEVKVFVNKSNNPSSIPETHMVERTDLCKLFSDVPKYAPWRIPTPSSYII